MHRRLRTDGGDPTEDDPVEDDSGEDATDETAPAGDASDAADAPDEADGSPTGGDAVDRSNVEVTEAGEAEPADPKWERPDPEDIPEFEIRADRPAAGEPPAGAPGEVDPTAGMPNDAAAPGTRISEEGTEGFVAALELCARLPEDVRLPEEAADLVPVAVEAELERDVQSFAAAEFDNPNPHVQTLSFEEADGEIWLRIRLGVPPEAFADLDPEAIRTHALRELEGVF